MLQWGNRPGEKAHWILALAADESDIRPENADKALHSPTDPSVQVVRTIDLVGERRRRRRRRRSTQVWDELNAYAVNGLRRIRERSVPYATNLGITVMQDAS